MLLRRLRIQASLRQVASPRLQRLSTTAAVATGGGGRRKGSWRLVGGSVAAAATLAGAVSATGVLDPPPVVEMEPPELPTNMVELRCRALVPSHALSPRPSQPLIHSLSRLAPAQALRRARPATAARARPAHRALPRAVLALRARRPHRPPAAHAAARPLPRAVAALPRAHARAVRPRGDQVGAVGLHSLRPLRGGRVREPGRAHQPGAHPMAHAGP